MAGQKLNKKYRDDTFKKFQDALYGTTTTDIASAKTVEIKRPKLNLETEVLGIFTQRKSHRNVVLCFVLLLITVVALAFFGLVFWNAGSLAYSHGQVAVVDPQTLQVIAVSFFAQLILVVRSITKALWDDQSYLNSALLTRMYGKKDKE